jgi:hypothetical protein
LETGGESVRARLIAARAATFSALVIPLALFFLLFFVLDIEVDGPETRGECATTFPYLSKMVADDDGAEPGARTEIAERGCLVESTGRVARVRDALLEARTVRSLMLSVVGGGELALGVCWGLAGIYTLLDVFGEYLSSCRGLWVHPSAAYTLPNSAVLASTSAMALFLCR